MGYSHWEQTLKLCWVPIIIHLGDPKIITQQLGTSLGLRIQRGTLGLGVPILKEGNKMVTSGI